MHRSPYFGQSVEFLQHREYVAATTCVTSTGRSGARQDRLYIKQFEEDTTCAAPCSSTSRRAWIRPRTADQVSVRRHARGQFGALDSEAARRRRRNHVRPKSPVHRADAESPEPYFVDLRSIRSLLAAEKTELFSILRGAAENHAAPRHDRAGLRFYLSNVRMVKGLKLLRQSGHDVLVFHVLDDDEIRLSVCRTDTV